MDAKSGNVSFYKLVFQNILQAATFLRHVQPGNYEGWVNHDDDQFGIRDLDTGIIYTYTNEH
jgi:hypothetical protein